MEHIFKMRDEWDMPECPQALPQPLSLPTPYRAPGPPEVQVHSLARLAEMSLHILFAKAQERVHADVEASLRLLQDRRQGRKHGKDEVWPGEETKTWAQKLLVSRRKVLLSNTV